MSWCVYTAFYRLYQRSFLSTGEIFYINRSVWASPSYKKYISISKFWLVHFLIIIFCMPLYILSFYSESSFPYQKKKKKKRNWTFDELCSKENCNFTSDWKKCNFLTNENLRFNLKSLQQNYWVFKCIWYSFHSVEILSRVKKGILNNKKLLLPHMCNFFIIITNS